MTPFRTLPLRMLRQYSLLVLNVAIVAAGLSHCTPAAEPSEAGNTVKPRDVCSDTWVATDALGRSLPTNKEAGGPRAGKTVGIFYFLWLGRHGDAGPFDISKIIAEDPQAMQKPDSPLWGPLMAPHHWGESAFGYYVSDDEGVLRKHAQMLGDAGVDMVLFDVTNQVTYPESWKALCRVFDESRRAGNHVPQIAFLCPFWSPPKVVRELWEQLYAPGLYPDLWFRWEGKPLILADPELSRSAAIFLQDQPGDPIELTAAHSLSQTFRADRPFLAVGGSFPTWAARNSGLTLSLHRESPNGQLISQRRCETVADNAWLMLDFDEPQPAGRYCLTVSDPRGKVGWWTSKTDVFPDGQAFADGQAVQGDRKLQIRFFDEIDEQIRKFFTFRKPQPDYFAGPTGPNQWSWLEVYPQHAFYTTPGIPEQMTVGVSQNAVDGKLGVLSHPRSNGRSYHDGKQPGPEGQDTSGRNFAEQFQHALKVDPQFLFITGWNEWIAGRFDAKFPLAGAGPVTFVDEFNQEYSRDIEPMHGGHGDNYYYQMIAGIRRYKGVRPVDPVTPRPIVVDGKFDDWKDVTPEFRDTIGDPVSRDHQGWNPKLRYVNKTGCNDLISAKVSCDQQNVYFLVQWNRPATPHADGRQILFLDTDCNASTGWMGYDLAVAREGNGAETVTVERNRGGQYQWENPLPVPCRRTDDQLELAIPCAMFAPTGHPAAFDFKWADNIQQTGDWSDFTRNGDVAPNDRYNYRAQLPR